jgi:hypothetical protein
VESSNTQFVYFADFVEMNGKEYEMHKIASIQFHDRHENQIVANLWRRTVEWMLKPISSIDKWNPIGLEQRGESIFPQESNTKSTWKNA